jgi:hypothetical protein
VGSVEKIIDGLVSRVAERYPQARIAGVKRRTEPVWLSGSRVAAPGERAPYMVGLAPARNVPEIPPEATPDQAEMVRQLASIAERSEWDDELMPGLAPGIRQVLIPSFFGCTEEILPDSVRVKPMIHDPDDVDRLPSVGFGPGTIGGQMLDRIRVFRAGLRGALPIFEADMQGPFSVASQVWGIEAFLAALYESPRQVHALLGRATDAIITFVRLMQEAAGDDLILYHCPPSIWFPPDRGIAISEDLLAVVSPATVREFIRPYAERVAEAFGGVLLHSCGYINDVVGELDAIRGLVGLNFAACETDLPGLAERCSDSLTLVTHTGPVRCRDLDLLDPFEHAALCGKVFCGSHRRLMCILGHGSADLSAERDGPRIARELTCDRKPGGK